MPEEKQPFEISACVLSGIIIFLGLVVFFGVMLVSLNDRIDKLEFRVEQLSVKLSLYEGLSEPPVTDKALTVRGVTYVTVDRQIRREGVK